MSTCSRAEAGLIEKSQRRGAKGSNTCLERRLMSKTRMFKNSVTALLALCVVVSLHGGSSVSAAGPQLHDTLREAYEAYAELRSLHFERATTIEETSADGTLRHKVADIAFTTASEWRTRPPQAPLAPRLNPSRFRLEFRSNGTGFLLLTDGKRSWAYMPKQRMYSKGSSLREVASVLDFSTAAMLHWFPFTFLVQGVIQNPEVIGSEVIEFGAEKRQCDVVGGSVLPPPVGPGRADPKVVDLSSFLTLLRVHFAIPESGEPYVYTTQPGSAPDPLGWVEPMRIKLWLDTKQHIILRAEVAASLYKGRLLPGGI